MAAISLGTSAIPGELLGPGGPVALEVVEAGPHTLLVSFLNGARPATGSEFSGLRLHVQDRQIDLGRCKYEKHPPHPMRRRNDLTQPPPGSDGRLIFLEE